MRNFIFPKVSLMPYLLLGALVFSLLIFLPSKAYAEEWNNCKCRASGELPEFACDDQADKKCQRGGHVCFDGGEGKNGFNNQGVEITMKGANCRPPEDIDENAAWTGCKCLNTNTYECQVGDKKIKDQCEKKEGYCTPGNGSNRSKKFDRNIDLQGVVCRGLNGSEELTNCKCIPGVKGEFADRSYHCNIDGKEIFDACENPKAKCEEKDEKNKNTSGITGIEFKNITGIVCNENDIDEDKRDPTLPPPPPPPCVKFDEATGKCTAVKTEFGDFSTDPSGFVTRLFALLLGLSGGIGALLIIRAGYVIMTSQGKPEALQKGREELVAAIVGLLFLILSFVILQAIGVDILRLPEFS